VIAVLIALCVCVFVCKQLIGEMVQISV